MGLFSKIKKVGGNIKNAVVKGAKDATAEVKRHPKTYAAIALGGAGLALGGAGAIAAGAKPTRKYRALGV